MAVEIRFRPATEGDLEFITRVYNDTVPSRIVTADLEPVTLESRRAWLDAHDQERRPVWIVSHGGKDAGWVAFSSFYGRPAYDGTAELSIYIDKDSQGHGVGKAALLHAVREAPRLRVHTVLAFIFGSNTRSIDLFMKQGFERWAILPGVADMAGKAEDLIILGRKVSPKAQRAL